jgi:putative phosphoribosyl transferase
MTERIYSDLESAGRELAVALAKHRKRNSFLLAIANGGVPVALPIADYLDAVLDILVIRRLFLREERQLPVCAVSVGGNMAVDQDLRTLSPIEDQFRQDAIEELSKRADRMRCNMRSKDVAGLNIVLVDNGIHTGSTFQIAINALREFRPRSVTVAVPVGDVSIKSTVESLADEVVCLQWCKRFGNSALWYKNFNRPSDEEIRRIIQTRAPVRRV